MRLWLAQPLATAFQGPRLPWGQQARPATLQSCPYPSGSGWAGAHPGRSTCPTLLTQCPVPTPPWVPAAPPMGDLLMSQGQAGNQGGCLDSRPGPPTPTHAACCPSPSLPVQISLPPTMRMTASDGTEYVALQMHFHWGSAPFGVSGSEHTVDGLRYVAEVPGAPAGSAFCKHSSY